MASFDMIGPSMRYVSMRGYVRNVVLIGFLGTITVWSALGTEFSITRFASGIPQIIELLDRMFPPNLHILQSLVRPTIETLQMALLGSTLPLLFAFPLSFLAAANTSPSRILSAFIRVIPAFLRTIPDLVWAMILVSAVGLGPMPGVLALTLHTIGGLTKMFYEAIENTEQGVVQAMEALGVGRSRTILFAIIPNVLPAMISCTLLYWEYNNRAATVLGLVGAGGIGFTLTQALTDFRYRDMMMCLVVIIAILVAIDFFSAYLRKKII